MAVNVLLSFAFHGKTNLGDVQKGLRGQGLLMVDSGAFTAFTSGKKITVADYAAYLRDWHGAWDTAVTLDVIGDHHATMRNTLKLHEMGLKVLPVYTFGTPMAELDAMVKEFDYICVGGTVPFTQQREQLSKYHKAVRLRAAANGCAVHALGVGSPPALLKIQPYTADSSAASSAPVYGNVLVWDGTALRSVTKDRALRYAKVLRAHGIHPGLVQAGRAWEQGRRITTGAVGFLAVAIADEFLKRRFSSPAPGEQPEGPHLYSACAANTDLPTPTPRHRTTRWTPAGICC